MFCFKRAAYLQVFSIKIDQTRPVDDPKKCLLLNEMPQKKASNDEIKNSAWGSLVVTYREQSLWCVA